MSEGPPLHILSSDEWKWAMSLYSDLWTALPELVRNYPPDQKDAARELAYALFDRFARTKDDDGMTRLRFAMETQDDLRRFYRAFN